MCLSSQLYALNKKSYIDGNADIINEGIEAEFEQKPKEETLGDKIDKARGTKTTLDEKGLTIQAKDTLINFRKLKIDKAKPEKTEAPDLIKIKPEWEQERIEKVVEEEKSAKGQATPKTVGSKLPDRKPTTTKADATVEDIFSNFFEREEIIVPDIFEYDKKNFNADLPFGALAQGALALK